MEKKKQKEDSKKPVWSCKYGCRLVKPCEHLEALLPRVSKGSIGAQLKENMDLVSMLNKDTFDLEKFVAKLEGYDLNKFEIDAITYRYAEKQTYKEIASSLSLRSPQAARNMVNGAVEKLKQKGYGK